MGFVHWPKWWIGGAAGALAALWALLAVGAACAAPPSDLDAYAQKAMQVFGAPGMAVAIVEGHAITTRVFGVKRLGSGAGVDPHTVFPIGSNTKAFTAAALAILVDEGKLAWTEPVAEALPGFRMWDPYASHEMTILDLLSHRSGLGLGEGDLLFVPATTRSRADIVAALRELKPKTSFRSVFAYDNILYPTAGELVLAVSGESWEDFVRARIFAPAGMSDAVIDWNCAGRDHVAFHARIGGPVRGVGPISVLPPTRSSLAAAPAGAICASASDMGKWLRVQLARGALPGGGRLFSVAASKEMWTPQTVVPISPAPKEVALIQPNFEDYGLGFFLQDYRGFPIVTHSGAVLGGVSAVAIIPEKNVAFAVMINSEDSGARWAVFYHLLDHYLGLPPVDWIHDWKAALGHLHAEAIAKLQTAAAATHSSVGPSLPLSAYVGPYRDP
ncbi:MAG: serine hydrolase domain-containing protein, partial [Caulobacteraceae bacterium]